MTNLYTFRGYTLPADIRDSLDAYVESGRQTGGFLEAVINNDLRLAISRADDESIKALPAILGFLFNECPSGCSGRPGAWQEWIKKKYEERHPELKGAPGEKAEAQS